jgi:hypothetical protein
MFGPNNKMIHIESCSQTKNGYLPLAGGTITGALTVNRYIRVDAIYENTGINSNSINLSGGVISSAGSALLFFSGSGQRGLCDANGNVVVDVSVNTGGVNINDGTGTTVFSTTTSGIGFFNVTPNIGQQTGGMATAGATYTGNEQGMINRMYTALRNYGLLT